MENSNLNNQVHSIFRGRWAWGMRLNVIFVVLLGSAGIAAWQHDNTQESVSIVPQFREERAAPSATTEPTTTPYTNISAPFSTPTPLVAKQPDPFKALLKAQENSTLPTVTVQPVQQNQQAIQDPFRQFVEESKHENSTVLISPFGSQK